MADAPEPVKLSDPATTPILGRTGRQERDRPIYIEVAPAPWDKQWEVEVTPLVDTTANRGRDLNPAAKTDGPAWTPPRAVFEVRAAWFGVGLKEFGSIPGTRKVATTHTEDVELAMAIARAAADVLKSGSGDRLDLIALAKDVERRRSA